MAAPAKSLSQADAKPAEAGRRVVRIPFPPKTKFWELMVEKGWAVEAERLRKDTVKTPAKPVTPEKPKSMEKKKLRKLTAADVESLLDNNKIDELASLAGQDSENLALVVHGAIEYMGETSAYERNIADGNCVILNEGLPFDSTERDERSLKLLGNVGVPALPYICEYLLSKRADRRRRRKLAEFLATSESPRHVRLLIEVYDRDRSSYFISALEQQSDVVHNELVKVLESGNHSQHCDVAFLAILAKLGNSAMLDKYSGYLDTHCEFANELIRHLIDFGEDSVPILSGYLDSRYPTFANKLHALYAFERIASPDSLEAALGILVPDGHDAAQWNELVTAVKKVVLAVGPASVRAIESRLLGGGLTENMTNHALLEFLGVLDCEESVAVLARIASSQDHVVRSRVALTLGETKRASAFAPLEKLLKDNEPLVAQRAADALCKSGLVRGLSDIDTSYCHLMRNAANDVDYGNAAVMKYLLSTAVRHRFSEVRKTAAEVLGLSGKSEAVPILISLLSDNESTVRISAAHALGMNREEKAIKHLIRALGDNTNPVAMEAAASLGIYHEAMDTQDNDEDIVMNRLIGALSHKNKRVRYNAIQLISDIGASAAIPALKRLALEDREPKVRGKALKALTNHAEQNINTLIEALGDPESQVVEIAIAQLTILEDVGKHAVSVALKNNKRPEVRIGATIALSRSGDLNVLDDLKTALTDKNKEVRLAAIRNIGALTRNLQALEQPELDSEYAKRIRAAHSDNAIKPLLKMLEDEDHDIRAASASVICDIIKSSEEELVGVEAVPNLIAILRNGDEEVRENVVTLLGSILQCCETEDEVNQYLEIIEKSSNELRGLLGRALDMVSKKNANATQEARGICEEFVRLAKEKGHKFENGHAGPYR